MTSTEPLYIRHSGPALLETPLLNKGSAFSREERIDFNLTGLLPPRYETISEQLDRAYRQYSSYHEAINKHIYLRVIQDNNETLFYRLLTDHLEEMMPIIYTPTVGDACEKFSDIYRSSRGLFISYSERDQIDDILRNATKQKVKVIVDVLVYCSGGYAPGRLREGSEEGSRQEVMCAVRPPAHSLHRCCLTLCYSPSATS